MDAVVVAEKSTATTAADASVTWDTDGVFSKSDWTKRKPPPLPSRVERLELERSLLFVLVLSSFSFSRTKEEESE